jgi:hypothetical protein
MAHENCFRLLDISEAEDGTIHLRIGGIDRTNEKKWIQEYDWIQALQNDEIAVENAILALKTSYILERNSLDKIVVEPEYESSSESGDIIQVSDEMCTEEYFQAYADLEVHELMLKDGPRMDAYRKAILGNSALFSGKAVLDVGCGTGILSMWAAKAGSFCSTIEQHLTSLALSTLSACRCSRGLCC